MDTNPLDSIMEKCCMSFRVAKDLRYSCTLLTEGPAFFVLDSDTAESWEDRDKKIIKSWKLYYNVCLHIPFCPATRDPNTADTDIGAIFYFGVISVTGQTLPFPFP